MMLRPRLVPMLSAAILFVVAPPVALFAGVIRNARISEQSFDPSAHEHLILTVDVAKSGRLSVRVLDRDGYTVTTLASSRLAERGPNRFDWNGLDDRGAIVADEAYSFDVYWSDGKSHDRYCPALHPAAMAAIPTRYYSRRSGTLSYQLPVPSRVHLQVGTARKNTTTGEMEGPILKTIVDRKPRTAGTIAEQWNGFDESRRVFVPDLPDFVVAVAATPLPENSVIAFGNKRRDFITETRSRHGTSVLPKMPPSAHHGSLDARADTSPQLRIEPLNAAWSDTDSTWEVNDGVLRARITPVGDTAVEFATQPATLYQFLNGQIRTKTAVKSRSVVIDIPAAAFSSEPTLLSVNWRSEYGPVAVNSIRIRRRSQAATMNATESRR